MIISDDHIYLQDVRKTLHIPKPRMTIPVTVEHPIIIAVKNHMLMHTTYFNVYYDSIDYARTLKDILYDPLPAVLMSSTGTTMCINLMWLNTYGEQYVYTTNDCYTNLNVASQDFNNVMLIQSNMTALHALFRILYNEVIDIFTSSNDNFEQLLTKYAYLFYGNVNALLQFIKNINNDYIIGTYRLIPSMKMFEGMFGINPYIRVAYRTTDINKVLYCQLPVKRTILCSTNYSKDILLAFSMFNEPCTFYFSNIVIIAYERVMCKSIVPQNKMAFLIDRYGLGEYFRAKDMRIVHMSNRMMMKLVHFKEDLTSGRIDDIITRSKVDTFVNSNEKLFIAALFVILEKCTHFVRAHEVFPRAHEEVMKDYKTLLAIHGEFFKGNTMKLVREIKARNY